MARLAIIIVICAFLVIVQAHDHVKTRHVHPAARHSQRDHKNETSPKGKDDENCTCVCDDEELKVVYSSSTGIIGIYNSQAGVGLVIDTKANLVVIFNEKNHIAIVVNYQDQKGYFIQKSHLKITFKYLIHLKSLKSVYEAGKKEGKAFDVNSVPDDVSKELKPLLAAFGSNYSSLSDLIRDVQSLSKSFGSLSKILGSGSAEFGGDFGSLTQRFQGLFGLFGRINGGANATRNFRFNLGEFLQQPTGLASFADTIRQLSGSYNISQLFGSNAGSSQQLLGLIAGFGGSDRFDQVWQIISRLASLSQNNSSSNSSGSSQELVSILTQFFGNQSFNSSSFGSQQWESIIRGISQQFGSSNNSFPGFSDLLRNLSSQQGFNINGIDFSSVISGLLNPNPRGFIYNIIQILTSFNSRFSLQQTVPNLITQIICLFTLPNRIFRIRNFFPNVSEAQIDSLLGTWGNILEAVLRFWELEYKFFDTMSEFWTRIPFIGLFLGPLNEALAIYTRGYITFGKIFASGDARRIIKEGILSLVHRGGGGGGGGSEIISQLEHTFEGFSNSFGGFLGGGGGGGSQSTTSANQSSSTTSGPLGFFGFRQNENADLEKKQHHDEEGKHKKPHHHG